MSNERHRRGARANGRGSAAGDAAGEQTAEVPERRTHREGGALAQHAVELPGEVGMPGSQRCDAEYPLHLNGYRLEANEPDAVTTFVAPAAGKLTQGRLSSWLEANSARNRGKRSNPDLVVRGKPVIRDL